MKIIAVAFVFMSLGCGGTSPVVQTNVEGHTGAPPLVEASCEVRVVWNDGPAEFGTTPGPDSDEARQVAFAQACAKLGTCDESGIGEVVWIIADGNVRVQMHPGGKQTAGAASPEGHSSSCAAAVSRACPPDKQCRVVSVDGIAPGWLQADLARVPAEAFTGPGGVCRVEMRRVLERASGTGTGVGADEAIANARAEACAALGTDSCAANDYVVRAQRLTVSMTSAGGMSSGSSQASIELLHTDVVTSEATSTESRLHACREAVHRACQDACTSDDWILTALDGVDVRAPNRHWQQRSLFGP